MKEAIHRRRTMYPHTPWKCHKKDRLSRADPGINIYFENYLKPRPDPRSGMTNPTKIIPISIFPNRHIAEPIDNSMHTKPHDQSITHFQNSLEENLFDKPPKNTHIWRILKIEILFPNPQVSYSTLKMTEKKPRAPPSCGYCHNVGHTIRSCNDPSILHHRRVISQQINRHEPIADMIHYLNELDFPERKLVLSKLNNKCLNLIPTKSTDATLLETKFIAHVQNVYAKDEQQKRVYVLSKLYMLSMRGYMNLLEMTYTHYFSAFTENPAMSLATEFAQFCTLLRVHSFDNQYYTHHIDYNTVNRWYHFINYCRSQPLILPSIAQQQPLTTYRFVARTVHIPKFHETIECPICLTETSTPEISEVNCGHQFCTACIRSTIRACPSNRRCACPMCRAPVQKIVRKIAAVPDPTNVIDLTSETPAPVIVA